LVECGLRGRIAKMPPIGRHFAFGYFLRKKNVKYCDNNIGRSGNHCRAAIVATSSIFLRASAGGCRSGVVVARDRLVDR